MKSDIKCNMVLYFHKTPFVGYFDDDEVASKKYEELKAKVYEQQS